jgi:cation transport regulator
VLGWNRGLLTAFGYDRSSNGQRRSNIMPYQTDAALPDSVKNNLPSHAQDIYREAFNSAWQDYQNPDKRRDDESLEEVAHKVAWAAVKQKYEKVGGEWQPKG